MWAHVSESATNLSVVNMRRKAVDLRLGEALRNDVAHDVAQPQQRLVVQVCRPSVGEGNEAPGRQLADEEARRRVRRGRTRAPELKLRIRRLARVADWDDSGGHDINSADALAE